MTVKEKPGRWKKLGKQRRQDKVVLNRLRLEHTNLTHSYRFDDNVIGQPPICNWCRESVLTVKHIICVCPNLATFRDFFFGLEGLHMLKAVLGEEGSCEDVMQFVLHVEIHSEI